MRIADFLPGMQIGYLKTIELFRITETTRNGKRRPEWYVLCRCRQCDGLCSVRLDNLGKASRSCGCVGKLERREYHGFAGTSLPVEVRRVYQAAKSARDRCRNERHARFKDYGGRPGIDWGLGRLGEAVAYLLTLPNAGKAGYSLDRIQNDSGYIQGNCRFADAITQANNRRPSRRRCASAEESSRTDSRPSASAA